MRQRMQKSHVRVNVALSSFNTLKPYDLSNNKTQGSSVKSVTQLIFYLIETVNLNLFIISYS